MPYFFFFIQSNSPTESSPAHPGPAARGGHEPAAAILPHPVHPAERPVQRPPEQEEGLVVRSLRRALDRQADGAASR